MDLSQYAEEHGNIVTLCGYTKFKDDILKVGAELSLKGYIVLYPVFLNYAIPSHMLEELKQLHLDKIKLSNAVYVVNKNQYLGENTKREIEYAKSIGKPVIYVEVLKEKEV
jgi:hypothetical protein